MGDSGIGEMTQVLSLTVRGITMSFKATKEAIINMTKFALWLKNKMNTKAGQHTFDSLKKEFNGAILSGHIDSKDQKAFEKEMISKKIRFACMDNMNTAKDKNIMYYVVPQEDAVPFQHLLEKYKEKALIRDNKKENNEAEIKRRYGMNSIEEAIAETGIASLSDEEFNEEIKRIYGKNAETIDNLKEKKTNNSIETRENSKKIARNAYKNELILREDTSVIPLNMNKVNVLNETETTITTKYNELFSVTCKKSEVFDDCLIINNNEELLIETIDDKLDFSYKMKGKDFADNIKNDGQIGILPITIDKSLIKYNTDNNLFCRVPNTDAKIFVEIPEDKYKIINDGKTVLSFIVPEEKYKIYNKKTECEEYWKGEQLKKYYSEVKSNYLKNIATSIQKTSKDIRMIR